MHVVGALFPMAAHTNARILLASRSAGLISACRSALVPSARLDIAYSAQEVLDTLSCGESPGLLLLDGDLPGMDIGQLVSAVGSGNDGRPFPISLIREPVSTNWLNSVIRRFGQEVEVSAADAQTDPITGLHTRGALLSMLFCETDRVQRMKTSLSLMMFAIDDFDEWKARLGGAGWAELLRQVVERVRRLLRTYDLFGRMGECKFVLGLPGCSVINAASLADRIGAEVFSAPFSVSGTSIRLTGGFGIAPSEGRSPVVVLREAEEELQRAQAAGPGSIRVSHQRH